MPTLGFNFFHYCTYIGIRLNLCSPEGIKNLFIGSNIAASESYRAPGCSSSVPICFTSIPSKNLFYCYAWLLPNSDATLLKWRRHCAYKILFALDEKSLILKKFGQFLNLVTIPKCFVFFHHSIAGKLFILTFHFRPNYFFLCVLDVVGALTCLWQDLSSTFSFAIFVSIPVVFFNIACFIFLRSPLTSTYMP